MSDNCYRTLDDFDAYICFVGRVQVSKGAEYQVQSDCMGNHLVYFLNTKNYLPIEAVRDFLQVDREKISVFQDKTEENDELEK